jgi:ubiquinone/menaquinone biosynthesis C-methylase UbiE
MFHQAAHFAGHDIPAHYDRDLGPHLFVDYAADLAQRAAAAQPARVLEIAAGTGILTRALRDALPAHSALVASDLNPPMLEIARQKFSVGENVVFQPADAAALPFADGTFDALACQFGVMFFPDKDKAYREAFRVLAPGGRYVFSVWDSFEFNAFASITHEAVANFLGENAPAFFRVPFGYHRVDPIKASLIGAGFEDISVHVLKIDKTIANPRGFAEGLILGNPIVAEIGARATAAPAAIIAVLTEEFRGAFGSDPTRTTLQAIVCSARKP